MQVEQYSDRSIAVYGDTKPWVEYLKSMGGRYNKNLSGGPGWIFSIDKKNDVLDFVDRASQSEIPTLQPNKFLEKSRIKSTEKYSSVTSPEIKSSNLVPRGVRPTNALVGDDNLRNKPREVKSFNTVPQEVSFPNIFVGADGLSYQIILYTVNVPNLGQRVILELNNDSIECKVTNVKNTYPIDNIVITSSSGVEYEAGVLNGKWKIPLVKEEHNIKFL